jgi:phage gp36-like protein
MFIQESDYEVQVRQEIKTLLTNDNGNTLAIAERMAQDQIRAYIGGRFDMDAVFSSMGEKRDFFIVMLVIDLTLYHLWSKRSPRNTPEVRKVRYEDALQWLTDVSTGKTPTMLPPLEPSEDNTVSEISIQSRYKPNDNKF